MTSYCIQHALIINEGVRFNGSLLISRGRIERIFREGESVPMPDDAIIIDAAGKILMPGVIDDQVHFREPGFEQKETIAIQL